MGAPKRPLKSRKVNNKRKPASTAGTVRLANEMALMRTASPEVALKTCRLLWRDNEGQGIQPCAMSNDDLLQAITTLIGWGYLETYSTKDAPASINDLIQKTSAIYPILNTLGKEAVQRELDWYQAAEEAAVNMHAVLDVRPKVSLEDLPDWLKN